MSVTFRELVQCSNDSNNQPTITTANLQIVTKFQLPQITYFSNVNQERLDLYDKRRRRRTPTRRGITPNVPSSLACWRASLCATIIKIELACVCANVCLRYKEEHTRGEKKRHPNARYFAHTCTNMCVWLHSSVTQRNLSMLLLHAHSRIIGYLATIKRKRQTVQRKTRIVWLPRTKNRSCVRKRAVLCLELTSFPMLMT